jgi:hypothetical protein
MAISVTCFEPGLRKNANDQGPVRGRDDPVPMLSIAELGTDVGSEHFADALQGVTSLLVPSGPILLDAIRTF